MSSSFSSSVTAFQTSSDHPGNNRAFVQPKKSSTVPPPPPPLIPSQIQSASLKDIQVKKLDVTTTTTTTTTTMKDVKQEEMEEQQHQQKPKSKLKKKKKYGGKRKNGRSKVHSNGHTGGKSATGNIPDIYWRAITMEDLRLHPLYDPLPLASTITTLNKLEDVRLFRQDSWQWDALHSGRCTTSQASPALGFLEPNAAKFLGIPRSLQKGCMGAHQRLSQPAMKTLEEMRTVLCSSDKNDDNTFGDLESEYERLNIQRANSLWKKLVMNKNYPFAAKYIPRTTKVDIERKRNSIIQTVSNLPSPMAVRMKWGNAQEATSILTAINYFAKSDPKVRLKEVGMCGAGLEMNSTIASVTTAHPLLLGASPDSIIQHGNGTIEVLEVKNHCPFVAKKYTKGKGKKNTKKIDDNAFRIREMPMQTSIPPAYMPQMMMEMMCMGPECKSAVMVRQTATTGAVILRLHRDDAWIEEMMYWLQRFVKDYVQGNIIPKENFFSDHEDDSVSERYMTFLQWTKDLSEQVELVDFVKHESIQRMLAEDGIRLSLFLD